MKEIVKKYTVYSFNELNDKAKEKAYQKWYQTSEWGYASEAEDTIKEIEKLFSIKLKNWSISDYQPEYPDIHFNDSFGDFWEQEERLQLSGNRARSFLWNNFGHVLYEGRFLGSSCKTSYRHSRVNYERVYDGTCPLTGVCFDNDALDPLAYFCFGVEWSEELKKRVPTKRDANQMRIENRTTVKEIIRDCVHSLFESLNDYCAYYSSEEYFEEECNNNDWTFLEDGTMFNN